MKSVLNKFFLIGLILTGSSLFGAAVAKKEAYERADIIEALVELRYMHHPNEIERIKKYRKSLNEINDIEALKEKLISELARISDLIVEESNTLADNMCSEIAYDKDCREARELAQKLFAQAKSQSNNQHSSLCPYWCVVS